jgi:hypothetical protein
LALSRRSPSYQFVLPGRANQIETAWPERLIAAVLVPR